MEIFWIIIVFIILIVFYLSTISMNSKMYKIIKRAFDKYFIE
jgi:hypothetical protein